jgi:polyhydroxyalkanoate synthesis repressor PhaR
MTRPEPNPTDPVHVRKYPNRRLYDQTRGGHITHDQLYDLVASGRTVVVTDTATDRDITNVVLAQVLIERDPLKLAAFPPSMLHQLIRTNDQILQSFITRYFNQMMEAFLAMRQQFGSMLPTGAPAMPLTPFDWAMAMMRGASSPPTTPEPAHPAASTQSAEPIATLQARLDQMAAELAALKKKSPLKKPPAKRRSR